ncbi:polysaccharide deacetylase family protein [Parageobacillus thermoglucosidasius]|uniref:polysaccharide deacetylase family protein n=1 Tax=Parageobacillus thermoglucosidasius TaxID=1426 RepID=UPI0001D190D9|nr:polysaccharide deacetylase [Parageobacillus thermoglucosidasius C56-YS93]MBY6267630.1 polysaccharide deacetylase family protein [Parageobacillus thermoglucosidasius]OUM90093.1 MAG: polysaccharide deacetylase [Parageobacillus thermoglucosidasius]RDE26920.1 polysaccharide deacetylase family protein [Parageobacillus thermoglucosidasius]
MPRLEMIEHVETSRKAVAITFDDGPSPVYTLKVLDIFEEASGKATFFMIGRHMEKYPEVVQTVKERGHEIGNHTYSHDRLTSLDKQDCLREIERVDEMIAAMTGRKASIFRPPYLDYHAPVVSVCGRLGYKMIGALNTDALDWEQPGVDHIVQKTRRHIRNGSILLFHDGFGDRSQTVEAVKILVSELHSQGYELVTVSELLKLKL